MPDFFNPQPEPPQAAVPDFFKQPAPIKPSPTVEESGSWVWISVKHLNQRTALNGDLQVRIPMEDQKRAIDPMQPLAVKPERLQACRDMISKLQSQISPQIALQMIYEMGYGDQVGFGPRNQILWRLTDLQTVAFAACLIAVAETGQAQKWTGQ